MPGSSSDASREEADRAHMRAALALAARGLGQTWPNPSVGCVIVSASGRVVGRGTTAPGGRPHAEALALAAAGEGARGGTAYVTLEPCAHHGETPPCADALVAAGIARVVAAEGDPDRRVDGRGFARLAAAGVAITTGVAAEDADALNAGFFRRVRNGRPLVTLKLAATLDGRIATTGGESRWITGEAARREGHLLRATHDAIMVGIGTVLADDPELTCRLEGARARPLVRIVADRALRLPQTSRLARNAASEPLWILHGPDAPEPARAALAACGARLVAVGPEGPLAALAAAGLTRVLVEGGARLAAALLRDDLVDRLAWFAAPALLGADALAATSPLGLPTLAAAPRFRRLAVAPRGADVFTLFERAR